MKKKKIYISGKISGIEEEAPALFKEAQNLLESQGYEVVNPMEFNHEHDKSWSSFMKEDIKALCDCDEIYMLDNWQHSRGAVIEHNLASNLGMVRHYQ